ncbi:MAG: hypothetical protein ACT4TC_20095 [Myxococcaceae bacterium]
MGSVRTLRVLIAACAALAGCGGKRTCTATLAGIWDFNVTYTDAKSRQIDAVGSVVLSDQTDGTVAGSWMLSAQSLSNQDVAVTQSEVVQGTATGRVSVAEDGLSFTLTLAAPRQRTVTATGSGSCEGELSGTASGTGVTGGVFTADRAQ